VVLGKSRAAESDGSLSIVAMMSPYRATTQPRSGGLHFDVFASDIKAMGRLLIAAFLMLVAGDNAIAGDQGPAFQLQINPSNEPSQSLMLACSGLLTITGGPKSGNSGSEPIELVINGDFVDFLQLRPWNVYGDRAQGLEKVKQIVSGNARVFTALGKFIQDREAQD
jgi:hypothetical protein